jgi:uncharacterized protein
MYRSSITAAVLASAALLVPLNAHALDYGKQKVVYHINFNDERQQQAALGNVQNHINAVGEENIEVVVVMHGPGLDLAMNAKNNENIRGAMDSLRMQNVKFNACNITIERRNVDRDNDLYEISEADVVPSGVAHISYLQSQGYTYIKP